MLNRVNLFAYFAIGLSVTALLSACGPHKKSKKSENYKYSFTENGCPTEEHQFSSTNDLCNGLRNPDLNHSCAERARREYFAQMCPGQNFDQPASANALRPPLTGPTGNAQLTPSRPRMSNGSEARSEFSYEFTYDECPTDKHSFDSMEAMCQGLKNETLNHGCALKIRIDFYNAAPQNCQERLGEKFSIPKQQFAAEQAGTIGEQREALVDSQVFGKITWPKLGDDDSIDWQELKSGKLSLSQMRFFLRSYVGRSVLEATSEEKLAAPGQLNPQMDNVAMTVITSLPSAISTFNNWIFVDLCPSYELSEDSAQCKNFGGFSANFNDVGEANHNAFYPEKSIVTVEFKAAPDLIRELRSSSFDISELIKPSHRTSRGAYEFKGRFVRILRHDRIISIYTYNRHEKNLRVVQLDYQIQ